MGRFETPLEEALYRSGFANTLSKLVSLRGPLNFRYEGKPYKALYVVYTVWVEFVCFINFVTVGLRFFQPGVDVVERCFTGFPFFSLSLGFFRVVYLFFRREWFAKLMEEYDRLYKGDPDLEADIAYYTKIIRKIPILLILLTAAPMAPWCFMPIINSMMGSEWALSVPSVWPIDPFRDIQTFATITILQSFAAGYTCLRVVLFDNMFYCYACRQLALTRHMSRELTRILGRWGVDQTGRPYFRDAEGRLTSKADCSRIVAGELHQWTINHQHSLRLAKELQTLYSPSLLYQYAMISINLCTNAFVVVYSDSDFLNVFLCFLYVIGNSLELLITCRIGDLITEESNNLEQASLGSHVYALEKEVYSHWFKMILTRSRVSIKLSALGVFPLNTGTFKDIMVTTYSFFTLLKSMKERN
nr:olfactory receptor 22 [Tropidothorax elegans]